MKKLTRTFTASLYDRTTLTVNGETFEVANLLKSGITNRSVILVGQDDKWNQVEIQQYGINANTTDFVNAVNSGVIPLTELGFSAAQKKRKTADSSIKHEDYERLEKLYPAYPYYEISKLHRHITEHGRKSNFADLKEFLSQLAKRGESVDEYVKRSNLFDMMHDTDQAVNAYDFVYEFDKPPVKIQLFAASKDGVWAFDTYIMDNKSPHSEFIYSSKNEAIKEGAHAVLLSLRSIIVDGGRDRSAEKTLQECFKEVQNF